MNDLARRMDEDARRHKPRATVYDVHDARLHRYEDRAPYPDMQFVSYYDAGAGVYLAWRAGDPRTIHVVSQDGRRTLGEIPTDARKLQAAAAHILQLINDPTKAYGETAGLWDAGVPGEWPLEHMGACGDCNQCLAGNMGGCVWR